MEKIIDCVKRAIFEMRLIGKEPIKLQINKEMFYTMLEEMDDTSEVTAIENLGQLTYFVCGLAVEERNDIAKGTI